MEYQIYFARKGQPESGFYFPCNQSGRVVKSRLSNHDRSQYERCVSGSLDVEPGRVLKVIPPSTSKPSARVKSLRQALSFLALLQ